MKKTTRRPVRSQSVTGRSVRRAPKKNPVRKQHHAIKRAIRQRRSPLGRLFMHPTSIFAILVVGVLLAGLTLKVVAEDIVVNATVPASPLTTPATITSPQDGDIFRDSNSVNVAGGCPLNSYVKLYRNGIFAGVSICGNDATYSIQTSLVVGDNVLLVQAYNMTDQPGPTTPVITVRYQPAASSPDADDNQVTDANGQVGGRGIAPLAPAPLTIWSDFHFVAFNTNSTFSWSAHLAGGRVPYSLHVDWGDTDSSDKSLFNDESFTIKHTYQRAGYYPILLTARDSEGRIARLQIAALIKTPGSDGSIGAILNPPTTPATPSFWQQSIVLLLAWPVYTVLFLMTASFWLGERRQYVQFIRQLTGRGHRPRHV